MPHRIRPGFNLGGELAESDPLLQAAFRDTGAYSLVADRTDPHRFIIGRTGSGKSALFERLAQTHPDQVVRLSPEHISLQYIANLDVVKYLASLGVRMEIFFSALWKHVIVVEILRHRYGLTSQAAKESLLESLRHRLRRDPVKARALEYLDEFGDQFWCEAHERVRQVATKLEERLGAEAKAGIPSAGVGTALSAATVQSNQSASEVVLHYQRIVNDIQLPRLTEMINILSEELLDPHNFRYVIIDDLDREWADSDLTILIIRCLFQTVIDMQRVKNFKTLVALRTNIFQNLNYSTAAPAGSQDEKIRALALHLQWRKNDIMGLLEDRTTAASRRQRLSPLKSLGDILPSGRNQDLAALDHIVSMTLLRPRDAIKFMNIGLAHSVGKERISWEVIHASEPEYSQDRLHALAQEWAGRYPGLLAVFEVYRGSSPAMSLDEMTKRLEDVALLMVEDRFPGAVWVTELCHLMWDSSDRGSWYATYGPLFKLLYDIGFVGMGRSARTALRYSYEDPLIWQQEAAFNDKTVFGAHPAFRAALDIA